MENKQTAAHVIAVNNGKASEIAWNEMLMNVPKEDPIVVTHGEKYESTMWDNSKKTADSETAEAILSKYKKKCEESKRNCKFMKLAYHSGPPVLATQICEIAVNENAEDIWMGGHDRGDEITTNANLLKASVSATVSSMAPCSVHVIKEIDSHKHYGHRHTQAAKILLPGFFDAVGNMLQK